MLKWFSLSALIVYFDQLTKWLTVVNLKDQTSIPLIQDVFHFTYAENTGAAFGMLKDSRWVFMIVSTISIIAVSFYLAKFAKKEHWSLKLALSFILGGGVGNMVDRVLIGYVIDMLDFRLINFAIFNVADSFISIGAVVLMLYVIMITVQEAKEEKLKKQQINQEGKVE